METPQLQTVQINGNEFATKLVNALIQSLNVILVFFVAPFKIWRKSVDDLSTMKQTGYLDISKIDSKWPILTFFKRWFFDSFFTFLCFICYFVGFIASIVLSIVEFYSFSEFIGSLFGGFIFTYFMPFAFQIAKDVLNLVLVAPVSKFFSWLKKPAQYLDMTITKTVVKSDK